MIILSLFLFHFSNSLYYSNDQLYEAHLTSLSSVSQENGYDSLTQSFVRKRRCFQEQDIKTLKKERFTFVSPQSTDQLLRSLNIEEVEESIDYILNDNLFMNFLNKISEDSFSVTHNFFSFSLVTLGFTYSDNFLNHVGKQFYRFNTERFVECCGEYLIKNMDKGIALIYSFRITFATVEDRVAYTQKIKSKDYAYINKFLENLKTNLNKAEILKNGKVQIYAIQIGGVYNFEVLNKARDKEFLVSECTFKNFGDCRTYLSDLSKYMEKNFQEQKQIGANFVPLEHRELKPIPDLNYKREPELMNTFIDSRDKLFSRIINIKYIFTYLSHVKEFYPIELQELKELYLPVEEYYNELEKEYVSGCGRGVFGKSEMKGCTDEILEKFDWDSFQMKLKNFLRDFDTEYVLTIEVSNSYCFPGFISWEKPGEINIRYYKSHFYVESSIPNLECEVVEESKFVCSDGVFELPFEIERENNAFAVTCTNGYFGKVIKSKVEVKKTETTNKYSFSPIFQLE